MKRIPEPQLMDQEEQAKAYAMADFSDSNTLFVDIFKRTFSTFKEGFIIDLGCGPGDITLRLARAYPQCFVHGIDGSAAMLRHAAELLHQSQQLETRVRFVEAIIPGAAMPHTLYDAIVSNSLLHHMHEPEHFWEAVKEYGKKGAPVLVMDLFRPENETQARAIVEQYAANESSILKEDFYNSLVASFSEKEIKTQLKKAKLKLNTGTVSDRHIAVFGTL